MSSRLSKTSFLLFFFLSFSSLEAGSLELHGSASQSYIKTTSDDFLVKGSQDGSYEFSEIAINAQSQVTDKLHIGAQLISRDFGEEGNYNTSLDWGYGDYRVKEWLGLRAGKVRTPLGFYNEYRDVDQGRVSLLLDQGMYPESFRGFVLATQGLGVYGYVEREDMRWGSLEYSMTYGTVNLDETFVLEEILDTIESGAGMQTDYIGAFQLIWNTPLENLRLAYSINRYAGHAGLTFTSGGVTTNYDQAFSIEATASTYGVEYFWRGFTFVAEGQLFYLDAAMDTGYLGSHAATLATATSAAAAAPSAIALATSNALVTSSNLDTKNWYGQIAYQWNEQVSTHISYSESYGDKSNKNLTTYRKALTVGARYDIFANWLIKAEYNHMRGKSGLEGMNALNAATYNEDWGAFLFRTTFSF